MCTPCSKPHPPPNWRSRSEVVVTSYQVLSGQALVLCTHTWSTYTYVCQYSMCFFVPLHHFIFSLQRCPLQDISAVTGIYRHSIVLRYCIHAFTVQHTSIIISSLVFWHIYVSCSYIHSTSPPLPSPPVVRRSLLALYPITWVGEGVYRTVNTVIISFQYLQCMYNWCVLHHASLRAQLALFPSLPPQEEPQCRKWIGMDFKLQSKACVSYY